MTFAAALNEERPHRFLKKSEVGGCGGAEQGGDEDGWQPEPVRHGQGTLVLKSLFPAAGLIAMDLLTSVNKSGQRGEFTGGTGKKRLETGWPKVTFLLCGIGRLSSEKYR